jgi:hypothetical protein
MMLPTSPVSVHLDGGLRDNGIHAFFTALGVNPPGIRKRGEGV